jgi:ATP-dependent helicase/nuclease subunit A
MTANEIETNTMLTPQQQLAVDLVDKNVLVSAGAGSGKTHVLVERYVEILRRYPDCSLSNIVAVTFTRKAAAEMRSRLKARFLSLSQDEPGGRWLEILAEVDSARIGTIHSLCEAILKSHPADCGIDPQFELIDDLTQNDMLAECVDDALKEVIVSFAPDDIVPFNSVESAESATKMAEPIHEQALLEEFAIDFVQNILSKLVKNSTQFKQTLKIYGDDISLEALRAVAESKLADLQQGLLAGLTANREYVAIVRALETNGFSEPGNKLIPVREALLPMLAQVFDSSVDFDLRWQALLQVAELPIGNIGGNKPEPKELRGLLRSARDQAKDIVGKIPSALNSEDEKGFSHVLAFINLFNRTLRLYEERKQKLTAVDYNDLISLACACLEKPESQSRAYFNDKLQALLVDEFQDTNDMQATLLSLLAGEKTRVFLIGDDKQSIYKFQGADVATFNKWKSLFKNERSTLSGASLVTKLTHSFRSHPDVVYFVNAVFDHLLDADPELVPYVAAFEALEPARKMDIIIDDSPAPVVDVATGVDPGSTDQSVEVMMLDLEIEEDSRNLSASHYEAYQVGRWLKNKVDSGYRISAKSGVRSIDYGDCAVLVSKNDHFAAFETMFAQLDIPYVTFGGTGFLRRQEVADFENLFRFLDNPRDSHSLLAVLRSPFCAITDDLLHRVITEHINQPLWAVISQMVRLHEPGFEPLSLAVKQLRKLMDYAALLPLSELVQKIIEATGYDLAMLAAPDGKQRSRNVWKMVHLAAEHEHLSCGEFARRLALTREHKMKESEAPLDSQASVKLMTVHASKGLEFPVVALPCLGGQLLRNSDKLVYHPSYGLAFNSTRLDSEDPPSWYQVATHIDKQMEREEKKRLLYVAMTRARDNLGIFLSAPFSKRESYRQWIMKVLGLDQPGATWPGPADCLSLSLTSRSDGTVAPYTFKLCSGFDSPRSKSESSELNAAPVEAEVSADNFAGVGNITLFPASSNIAASSGLNPALKPALNSNWSRLFTTDPTQTSLEDPKVNEIGRLRITPRGDGANVEKMEKAILTAAVMGTFFHALMENLPPSGRRVDRDWIADIAFTQGPMVAHPRLLNLLVDEGERLLAIYYESRLHAMLAATARKQHELPYLIDAGITFEGDRRLDVKPRRPDLVFEDSEGQWHLVDYKTDHFNADQVDIQARKHREQIRTYVSDLRKLTGLSLTPSIYFAQHGLLYPI